MGRVDDLGVARNLSVAMQRGYGVVLQDKRGATYRLDTGTVDQCSATNDGGHTSDCAPPNRAGGWRSFSSRAVRVCSRRVSVNASATGSRSLVVLPTYNERENIESVLAAILSQAGDLEVLVVDDSSPDGTGTIVDRLADQEPRIPAINRSGELGLGTAYIQGFL